MHVDVPYMYINRIILTISQSTINCKQLLPSKPKVNDQQKTRLHRDSSSFQVLHVPNTHWLVALVSSLLIFSSSSRNGSHKPLSCIFLRVCAFSPVSLYSLRIAKYCSVTTRLFSLLLNLNQSCKHVVDNMYEHTIFLSQLGYLINLRQKYTCSKMYT